MLILVNCIECVKASAEKYELSEQYCDLVVGEHKSISFYDSEEDIEIQYEKVSWSCDSEDVVLASGEGKGEIDISAVKCSGKKHSHAVITAKYEDVTLKCDVVVYSEAKYKYKIIAQKSKKTLCVGDTEQFYIKAPNGKKVKNVKWYAKDESNKPTDCIKVDKKGNVKVVKINEVSPMYVYLYAKVGYIQVGCELSLYVKRNKRELEALRKIVNKTNYNEVEKECAISSKGVGDCEWDAHGHLYGIDLFNAGIKGDVSLKEFKHLKYVSMLHNKISAIDFGDINTLRSIDLRENCLKKINLRNNPKLTEVELNENRLKSIDLSNNKKITHLDLSENRLESIDLSNNKKITKLDLYHNKIKKIDLSNNKKLKKLNLSCNPLAKLDTLNNCSNLKELSIDNYYLDSDKAALKYVDVSNNKELKILNIPYNPKLKKLLLPPSDSLEMIVAENCGFKKLDIMQLPKIESLYVYGGKLEKVYTSVKGFEELTCGNGVHFIYNEREYTADEYCHRSFGSKQENGYDILNDSGMGEPEDGPLPLFELSGMDYERWLKYINDDSDVEYVQLNRTNIHMKKGLQRKMNMWLIDDKDLLKWKSSDNNIISVDLSGNATALSEGNAKLIAEYKGKEFICDVIVTAADEDNDEEELKKLIDQQIGYGATGISTDIYNSKQYEWRDGRLIGISWMSDDVEELEDIQDVYIRGTVDLNPFTYLEHFWGEGLPDEEWSIEADDLLHLKSIYISYGNDMYGVIHAENAKDLSIHRERYTCEED